MDMVFWSILLLLVGLGLIFLEIFVPSGGLLSCLSALAIVASLVVAFLRGIPFGVLMLGITSLVLPTVIGAALRWWPHTPIGRLILIQRPKNPDDVLPESEEYRGLEELVGRRGTAKSRMMPSGAVRIENRTYDAISEGMPIDEGQCVEVIDVRTHRIVVRPSSEARPLEVPPSEDLLSRPIDSLGLDDPLA
ncbi:MAG: NfeD family protein [Pirellulaceae bacterium]